MIFDLGLVPGIMVSDRHFGYYQTRRIGYWIHLLLQLSIREYIEQPGPSPS